ncbi:MAG: AsnC family transcriptional regulator [Candidatus Thorarchaeota archaeon]
MDNVDKQLVSLLQKNGRTSLSEIGKKLKMSHVAVSKRLDKLVKNGSVHVSAGVNAEKLDVKLLFMALEVESMDTADRLRDKYQNCPRLLMLAPVTGSYNLMAIMAAEDTWSLQSITGTCSLRTEQDSRREARHHAHGTVPPASVTLTRSVWAVRPHLYTEVLFGRHQRHRVDVVERARAENSSSRSFSVLSETLPRCSSGTDI